MLNTCDDKKPGLRRNEPVRYNLQERVDLSIVGQDGIDVSACSFEFPELLGDEGIQEYLSKSA